MFIMDVKEVHESYHSGAKLQRKIIGFKNFTYRNSLKLLIPYLKNRNTVLDIGSGVGTLDFYLAQKNYKVFGIDISTQAVKISRQNARVFGLRNIKFYNGNVDELRSFSKFDLIICSEIIEHVEDDNKLLKDLSKHLNKDGIIFLTTPLETAPLYKLGLTKKFDKRVGHLRRYTLKKLKNLIRSNNLEIENVYYSDGIFRNILFVFKLFDPIVRVANRFSIISDIFTFVDEFFLNLLGATDICLIIKRV